MEVKQVAPGREAATTPDRDDVVLLAEDDDAQRTLLTQLLTRRGLKVVPTLDGREALEILRDRRISIDVAVLDVNLPHISGHLVLQEMRLFNPSIPAIMISGDDPAYLLRLFHKERPYDVIQKPFRFDDLMQVIERCLEMRRTIRDGEKNREADHLQHCHPPAEEESKWS